MISTAPSLVQPSVVQAAFASHLLYWTKAVPDESLMKMLRNSLCFGVYALPTSSAELAGRSNPPQIGFARLITDEVSFAYLTDVFVFEEYQGKGLGTWLIDCVNEVVNSWPELRRLLLVSSEGNHSAYYKQRMGVVPFVQGKHGMLILSKKGAGSVLQD